MLFTSSIASQAFTTDASKMTCAWSLIIWPSEALIFLQVYQNEGKLYALCTGKAALLGISNSGRESLNPLYCRSLAKWLKHPTIALVNKQSDENCQM